ncbi:MAG TPA: JAB domain-containing protein [Thermodesulfovibrionales bacterium]|nr:JAB domain-containing protein [Thermodesulfovibrionales bacterium]
MIISEHKGEKIDGPGKVADIIRALLAAEHETDREREHFWAIGLNTKNRIKYIELVSLGTLSNSLIHPRETYRLAVMNAAAQLIIAHNHPSGDVAPSRDDIAITERLKAAGEIMGITLLDHVILGSDGTFTSMKEAGHL